MCEHHDEGQDEPLSQNLAHAITCLKLCPHDYIVPYAFHRLSNRFSFLSEDGRGEGLGEEEERGDLNKDSEDRGGPEDPTPAYALRYVGTAYGCYAGCQPCQDTIDGLAFPAFFFRPGISENTVAQLQ